MAVTVSSSFELIDRASPTIRSIRRELRELQADARAAGRDLDRLSGPGIQRQMEAEARATRQARQETDSLGRSADKAATSTSRLEQRAKGLESQARRTDNAVAKLDKTVGRIGKWGAIVTVAGGLVNVLGALAGGAIELLPRIGDLAGAGVGLGAAYVGAGAAMGTVKLATAGLSQALQGNKKALAGLTPDARAFVQELKSMRPELETLRESAQRGLFGGAGNLLDSLRRQAPAINRIVASTSSSLGGLANFAAGQISQRGFMSDLGSVVGEGNTAFSAAGKSAIYLGRALEQVMIAARPLVDWMSRMAVQESRLVLRHAELGRESGRLDRYFDRTKSSIQLFGQIGERVFGGLHGVFHAASNDGDTLWRSIDRAAGRFDRWANSFSGQSTMRRYFRAIQPELRALGTTTGRLIRLFADLSGGSGGMTTTIKLVGDLAGAADRALRWLGPFGKQLGGILTTTYALHRLGAFKLLTRAGGVAAGATGSSTLGKLFGAGGGIVGFDGNPMKPGMISNPIAVMVVDRGGSTPGIPGGGGGKGGGAASTLERDAGTLEKGAGANIGGRLLSRGKGLLADFGERAARGGAVAVAGTIAAELADPVLKPFVGKKTAGTVSKVGADAAMGAGIGSLVPGVGTGAGAVAGTLYGLAAHVGTVPRASITAGGAAGVASLANQQLVRGGPAPGQSLNQAHGYAQTAQALQTLTRRAQGLRGGLAALPVGQLKTLEKDAQRLAGDPALSRYARSLNKIASTARDALLKKAAPYFQQMRNQAGKSLDQIEARANANAKTLPRVLGRGSQAARIAVADSFALAADDVKKSMNAGVISTQAGMRAINSFLSRELKALGVNISPQLAGVIGAKGVQALAKTAQTGRANTAGRSAQGGGSGHGATFAAGGRIPGPAIGDHIPLLSRGGGLMGVADGGELIVNRHTERKADSILGIFGTRLSSLVANETRPHARAFATGGRVVLDAGVNMSAGQEPQILSDLRKLSGELRETVFVISGYRSPSHSVAVGGFADDPHTRGQAADIGVGSPTLASMFGVPERALKAVGLYRPFYPPSSAEANHVQLLGGGAKGSFTGGIGGGGGAVSVPTLKAPKVRGGGGVGAVAQGVLNQATKAVNQYVQSKAQTSGALDFSGVQGLGGDARANEALGRKMMLAAGWGAGQWPSLQALWTQESGWNANAVNHSSGAYGIPQALGHGHPYNLGDARAQIAWGLNYIKGRYGSPAAAEAHERANNWYSLGGRTPSWGGWHARGADMTVRRPTIFGAGENGPERVQVTPSGHSGVTINATAPRTINVHGGGISERRVRKLWDQYAQRFADEVAAEIASGTEEDERQVIENGV